MTISCEDLEKLTAGCKTTGDVDALYSKMLQHMINRSLEGELNAHLGYGSGQKMESGNRRSNTRNGVTKKTIKGTFGELEIETPRDREGSFEPLLVKKRQVRLAGMEEKILSLYSKGMTTRDIEQSLQELYGVQISHTIISEVTEVVMEEARAWQTRPLDAVYPIVWLDGLVIKTHHGKQVTNKAAHIAFSAIHRPKTSFSPRRLTPRTSENAHNGPNVKITDNLTRRRKSHVTKRSSKITVPRKCSKNSNSRCRKWRKWMCF